MAVTIRREQKFRHWGRAASWGRDGQASHDTGARTRGGARVSERAAHGEKRVPAQSLDRRAREQGQDGRVEEGPTSKAAGRCCSLQAAFFFRDYGGRKRLDRGKSGLEGPGNTRRLVQTSQAQGAVSAPPLQPPTSPNPSPQRTESDEIGDRSTCEAAGRNWLRSAKASSYPQASRG